MGHSVIKNNFLMFNYIGNNGNKMGINKMP